MEDRTYKQVFAVIIVAAIFGVAFYGSYLPMRKAEIYISTLQGLQTNPATSLQDLESRISVPLDYASPIGQEELVRNLANSVLAFTQQGADPTSTAQLIGFMNQYYNPILQNGKGMSFGQDLYLVGAINETAFATTGNPQYLAAAQKYYEEAETLGPNRPQPLYGLFDVYRAAGNIASTTAVADKILTNWPTDTNVRQALQVYENQSSTLKTTTGTK